MSDVRIMCICKQCCFDMSRSIPQVMGTMHLLPAQVSSKRTALLQKRKSIMPVVVEDLTAQPAWPAPSQQADASGLLSHLLGRLVAPMTMTWERDLRPSISVSSWDTMRRSTSP